MSSLYFRPPDPLCYDSIQDLPKNWDIWRRQFNSFMVATKSDKEPDATKVQMFLNLVGPKGVDLYDTFTFTPAEDKDKLDAVLQKFDEHTKLHRSLTVTRHLFFNTYQKENQTMEDYIKHLTKLCNQC